MSNFPVDKPAEELERRGHLCVPNADDHNIHVESYTGDERVLESLESLLQERLRLKVNREKSVVACPWGRKLLGYTVTAHRETGN